MFEVSTGATDSIECRAGGNTRQETLGPQAVHRGSSSINTTTPVQRACRAGAVFTRITHKTVAVAIAISTARMAHSKSRPGITYLLSVGCERIPPNGSVHPC